MRKFVILLLEILIGILIFSIICFPGIFKIKEYISSCPTYTVSFKDVDGLNVGSPVRLMGIQIGHIIRLELLESEIFVTFRITKENTQIPDNSIASVQFTGLAGSKSLEISPPGKFKSKNKKIIYAKEPIRVASIMQVQTTISENVLEFCRGVLIFFRPENIETAKARLQDTSEYIHETNQSIDGTLLNIKNSGEQVVNDTKEIQQFLNEQNNNINKAYDSFKVVSKNKNLINNMDKIQTAVDGFSSTANVDNANKKVLEFKNNLNNVNSKVKNFNNNVNKIKNREINYVSEMNESLKKTTQNLQGFIENSKSKLDENKQPDQTESEDNPKNP